ncbi:MAG: ABC transporter substrate-binding protein [Deltaproteobacteria bacterium]|nr:ABC transporter substrate-binding protein [Deltaproteobacteria bacterium]
MKSSAKSVLTKSLIMVAAILVLYAGGVEAQQAVKYGGTLTFFDQVCMVNPMSWDNADWNWKHGYDTGYFIEHLLMGDLQKGPRGTNQFDFGGTGSYIPEEVLRGELVERWEVVKNPMSVVFHLRKGVMWQEKPGIMKAREFVASDVVYSMTRLLESPKAKVNRAMDFIDHWEAKDKYTVIMHMKEWNTDWGLAIGWGFYDGVQAPEQEKAQGGPGKWQSACGTGPFMLTEYKFGHSTIYMKNPIYWDSEEIDGKSYKLPFVDKVISMLSRDEAARLAALRTGRVDMMLHLNERQHQDLKKTTPDLKWAKHVSAGYGMIGFRMDRKPFNDIRVRRALNMAIDRQTIVKVRNGGELLHFPFPKYFKNIYTPLDQLPATAKELFEYNPEKAKKLLTEAGYPNGFSFKCQYNGSSTEMIDYLSMIVAYLAEINVKMELNVMAYVAGLSRMTKKGHDEAIYVPIDHGPPLQIIGKLTKGHPWNFCIMNDDYVNETHKKLSTDANFTSKQRDVELKKLGVYLVEQSPGIMLPAEHNYAAWWPWVKNYNGERRVGAHRVAPIIARIWIDEDLKKKMGY